MLRRIADGLAFRIAVLLTIAFVPIGLIATSLANQVSAQMARQTHATLLARTSQAADQEAALIRLAFGAARAFSLSRPDAWGDSGSCSVPFIDFQARYSDFSFVGYIDRNGRVACGSDGVGTNVGATDLYQTQRANPAERTDVNTNAPISREPVLVMSVPVLSDGQFNGFVAMSLPHSVIATTMSSLLPEDRPLDLITVTAQGDILGAPTGRDMAAGDKSVDVPITDLVAIGRGTLTAPTSTGVTRIFTVTPILEGQVYAIGGWPSQSTSPFRTPRPLSPLVFPLVMWLASLGVAYFAVHRLVLNHISRIRRDMDRFAKTRRHNDGKADFATPLEIREIEQTWRGLADTILREEAELVNTILDKNVLLKEVHHRVKNNLQLISSILNMKMRKVVSPDARAALKEVQMRVMSIATVHRSLYETSMESRVSAQEILNTVIDRSIDAALEDRAAIDLSLDLVQIRLYPDQAVPLSLLASEVAINAAKFLGQPATGRPFIRARLSLDQQDEATFELVNSVGTPLFPGESIPGTGLGTTLIAAFAHQLGGEVSSAQTDREHRVSVRFKIVEFNENPTDSTIPPTTAG